MDTPNTLSGRRGPGWRLTLIGVILCLAVGAEGALAAGKRAKSARPKRPVTAAAAAPAAPAPPTWSPEELERRREVRDFVVVGVYRPVEMVGRVVTVPREVYLQSTGSPGTALSNLLGQTLEVRRRVPVPTAIGAPSPEASGPTNPPPAASASAPQGTPAAAPAQSAPAAKTPAPESTPPAAAAPASSATSAVARLRALKKAQAAPKPPAAAAERSPVPPSAPVSATTPQAGSPTPTDPVKTQTPERLAASRETTPEIMRPRPAPLPSAEMEVVVGRVQIVEIRGEIAVARVAVDGLGAAESTPGWVPAEVPAIMAGDLARFVKDPPPPEVPPPPPPPQALSEAERARLLDDRKKAQAEAWRRKNPRGKYERKSMKWKL